MRVQLLILFIMNQGHRHVGKKRPYSEAKKHWKGPKGKKMNWQEKRRMKKRSQEESKEIFKEKQTHLLFSHYFKIYYSTQFVPQLMTLKELDQLIAFLKKPLPIAIRINPIFKNFERLVKRFGDKDLVQQFQNQENKYELEANFKDLHFTPLPFYPKNLLFQLPLSKDQLKQTPPLKQFHKFIHACNDSGLITRQQVVSMIPPTLLDLKPGQRVFDMCAAPGSKTAQVLQFLHSDNTISKDLILGEQIVMANDVDFSRANMLTHQTQRFNTASVMTINHAAQFYPNVYEKKEQQFLFDRVLCDVPCSSDAVLRKLPGNWQSWTTKNAGSLHPLQLQIAIRGLELLKEGGLLSYSTCSLNPIQNEAVVSAILRKYKGLVQVIECRQVLNSFKTRKGMTYWSVLDDRKGFLAKSIEEDQDYPATLQDCFVTYDKIEEVKSKAKEKITPTMFFPPDAEGQFKQFIEVNLLKCVRVFPHDQDTSGFFITIFKKLYDFQKVENLESISYEDSISLLKQESKSEIIQESRKQEPRNKEYLAGIEFKPKDQDELIRIPLDDPDLQYIQSYYGLADDFPLDQLIAQTRDFNKILVVSKGIKRYLEASTAGTHFKAPMSAGKTIIVNLGVPLFKRNKSKFGGGECMFRICQEGARCVAPFMTKRVVMINSEGTFKKILQRGLERIQIEKCNDDFPRENLRKLTVGCFLIVLMEGGRMVEALVAHKHGAEFNLMISRECLDNFLIRYGLK